MDEVLEKFLKDQKIKIAEEKASLKQDPPYMEIRRHKERGHLQKENIHPITSQQDGASLPLGEEYERKKHKLQEELRKDYRKFMAEKDQWGAGDFHTVPERRRLSKTVRVRDAATLTEVCGLGWGVCSSEEDCSDEELILLQGRRLQRERDTRTVNKRRGECYTETSHSTSKLQYRNRTSASVATQSNERCGSVASQDTVCTTGLLIGAADREVTKQRRKEHYRRELQEQILEKQRHKRRERELDLKVPLTVMDLERKHFVSEPSDYRRISEMDRKLPRDDIIRLDTAEPSECLLQYKTDPSSPCRASSHLPSVAEVYKSPSNDAENSLSPSTAYGPIAGVSFPTSSRETHLLSPPHHEPRRNTYRSKFLVENEGVNSGLPVFPTHQTQTDRFGYKEELRKQIEERAAQRRVEKEERRRLEAELEADMRAYEPWGRGGGGAPLRDSTGNLITDLKQMHILNATAGVQRQERPGFVQTHSPQFTRVSESTNHLQSPQQHLEQDQYKAYLRQQMEEKHRKQAEERERQRAEEEKEERRLAEQREKIRREYEEELESRRRREMEQKRKNEELARLAEERRKEDEKKKKEEQEKERAAMKKQEEQERRIQRQQVERPPSPPIPTLQNKHRNPPHNTDLPPSQAPPSLENKNHLSRAETDRSEVVKELCALSRRLRSEQRRLEEQLFQTNWDHLLSSPLTDRHKADVFDMARLRMPVRGPSSRGNEPISFKENDDIMYRDVLMPLSRTQQSRYRDVEGGRGSVLLSESEFIDQNGAAFPVPPDVERKCSQLSARERRRLANLQSATEREQVQQHSFNMKKPRETNTFRMNQLQSYRHHNITAGFGSDEDKDEVGQRDERFNLRCPGRPGSIDTEPWVRAESSDTLRRLMSGSEL
ncbi:centrosome and spindle pole associated protein 1 isoform X1 [Paramisgurnus dabryanus]|uniref:centrosome and spindle pole associated protein 1 isoform X1 n=1 Tax=Paramisgurnus dabryanus TaxID=90735 RepID=UPI0031F3AAA1